mgnify:CR=1 FL=1
MKQDNSGERRILEQLPQVTLWETYPDAKFSFRMTPAEKAEAARWYTGQFRRITEAVQGGTYRMLILDELLSCISCGFCRRKRCWHFWTAVRRIWKSS